MCTNLNNTGDMKIRHIQTQTFGMKGNEAVTQRPLLHRFTENHLLWKNDHGDVLKFTESLQDFSHGFGLGFLHHGADPHHYLTLHWLRQWNKGKCVKSLVLTVTLQGPYTLPDPHRPRPLRKTLRCFSCLYPPVLCSHHPHSQSGSEEVHCRTSPVLTPTFLWSLCQAFKFPAYHLVLKFSAGTIRERRRVIQSDEGVEFPLRSQKWQW